MSNIADYTILPLTIPPLPAFPKPTTHTLYIRPHAPKIPTDTDAQSLFLVNVPVDSTPAHFKRIFNSLLGAGIFEDIYFEGEAPKDKVSATENKTVEKAGQKGKKRKRGDDDAVNGVGMELPSTWDRELRKSGGTAVVRLVDEKSVERVLKAIRKLHKTSKEDKWPVWGEGVEGKIPPLGSARYREHQMLRYPDKDELREKVNKFMKRWNDKELEMAKEAKRLRSLPDEDGFVTVTRGGRVAPARIQEAEAKKAEIEERERKKREGMGDFYRFQTRERRKVEQGELVKRFEEDRKRVELMKERRGKFRPET